MKKYIFLGLVIGALGFWVYALDLSHAYDTRHLAEPGDPQDKIMEDFLDQSTIDDARHTTCLPGDVASVGAVESANDENPYIYRKIQE